MANLSSRVWTIWRRMIVKSCRPTCSDVRNELLPNDTSTASFDLLAKLGIELVYVETSSALLRRCSGFAEQRRRLGWTSRLRRYRSFCRKPGP